MSEKITELDSSNFDSTLSSSSLPIVVDFWAPWCGPCKAIAPILNELAEELGDTVKICKVNIDNNSEVASKYEIRAIPTILIFKAGQIVDTIVGLIEKEDLKAKLGWKFDICIKGTNIPFLIISYFYSSIPIRWQKMPPKSRATF